MTSDDRAHEMTALFRTLPLDQAVGDLMRATLSGSGVSPVDYALLSAVAAGIARTPTALAELLGAPKATLTGWLDTLVERGMVVRQRSEVDGRRIEISLSTQGQAAHRRARTAFGRGYLAFVEAYDGDLDELSATLDRMTRALRVATDRTT